MRLPVAFYNSKEFGTVIGEPILLGRPAFATSKEYDKVVSKVKECYKTLVREAREGGLKQALDSFLEEVSDVAILDSSFKACLAEELSVNIRQVEKALLSTNYIAKRLERLKRDFKKVKKEDPVEYAEGFGELVSLLGFERAAKLLKDHGLRVGATTLNRLYKVSLLPVTVKRMIKEGKLPLTIAFELPLEDAEEAAEAVAGLKFYEAREALKKFRRR